MLDGFLKILGNLKEIKKTSGKTFARLAKNQFRFEILEKKIEFT